MFDYGQLTAAGVDFLLFSRRRWRWRRQAGQRLAFGVYEGGSVGAGVNGALGVGETVAHLAVAGGVAAARLHLTVGVHVRTEDQVGTAFLAVLLRVEVVGITAATAEGELLALVRLVVEEPALEAGSTVARLLWQLAHVG